MIRNLKHRIRNVLHRIGKPIYILVNSGDNSGPLTGKLNCLNTNEVLHMLAVGDKYDTGFPIKFIPHLKAFLTELKNEICNTTIDYTKYLANGFCLRIQNYF